MNRPISEYEAYLRRRRREDRLTAGCAWAVIVAGIVGAAFILWLAYIGLWAAFG